VFAEKIYLMLRLHKYLKNEGEKAGRVRDAYGILRSLEKLAERTI
jgi:hypothetical protein